jgi:hypothetical protein
LVCIFIALPQNEISIKSTGLPFQANEPFFSSKFTFLFSSKYKFLFFSKYTICTFPFQSIYVCSFSQQPFS